jgi:hypothetical protein
VGPGSPGRELLTGPLAGLNLAQEQQHNHQSKKPYEKDPLQ